MKNLIKIIGIITLVTVLGFSMIACGEDDGKDDIVPAGKITLTLAFDPDLDLNGKFVEADVLTDDDPVRYFFAAKEYDEDTEVVTFGEIANRRVSLQVWEDKGAGPIGYKGSDTLTFNVYIYDNDGDATPTHTGDVVIKFRRGIGIGEIDNIAAVVITPPVP